ncbi:flagellar hook-length control protein FliK [Psychrobacillus sp. NEAU-3TGS]|uniref:flagellar hook-length control protein FliK n=1 Tax=Psychrobacillus sp. NEAU-3TGS TaxID=2995412 RepID=UPI0024999029|nr:flagellar hook-length control protein FliK [Psychrobacillus sp. NEAU-3TGS]MDI2589256.1 flagellar hook-length control protein FliK [Psychrobacillus sp. NEAU-3TGS]
MNLATIVNMGNNIALPAKGQQLSPQSNQIFGNVFGQILSNQQLQPTVDTILKMPEQDVTQDILSILNTASLEELEVLLGSKELEVNPKQLKELLSKLLGEDIDPVEEMTESNVWDILAGVQQQANKLTDAITLSLSGQGPASPAEAKQAVQLLKIAQLIGNKSDLNLKQESTLFDLKQLLENVKESTTEVTVTGNQKPDMMQGLKHVTHQVIVRQVTNQVPNETIVEMKEETTNIQSQTSTMVQTKVETVSITLPTEKPAQSEEFLKELQKVMNRVQFGQTGGANRLVIKVYPEQLGTIRIELVQKDGILTAKMLASTALGKELLDSNSNHLKQSLVNQNIQIDKLEITQALQDPNRQERNQSFQESFKQQQQQQQEQEQSNEQLEDQSSFEEFLKEMEV